MVIHKLKVQKKYSTYHKKLPFLAGSELDVDHPGLDQTAAGRRRGGCPQGQAGQEKEDPPGREPGLNLSLPQRLGKKNAIILRRKFLAKDKYKLIYLLQGKGDVANNSGPPPLFVTDVVLDYQVGTHNKVTLKYNRLKKTYPLSIITFYFVH